MEYEEYEDLNKAKQKILYLMSVKYNGASNVEAHETDNSNADNIMINIIKWLNSCNNNIFQMLTFTKKEKDTEIDEFDLIPILNNDKITHKKDSKGRLQYKKVLTGNKIITSYGSLYFRSQATYMNFNQYVYNMVETLQNINRSFFELLPNIGFVEPENIDMYNTSFQKYITLLEEWKQITSRNGRFQVILKGSRATDIERTNLQREYDLIIQNTEKLEEYDETVKNTYNYRGGETNSRVIEPDSNNKLFLDDDDDE
jgi:hypothetical protein